MLSNLLYDGLENNLRFPGQYYDSETGFYYNFHRYYEPDVGRYLREDEVRKFSKFNLFEYCFENSIRFYDFEGFSPYGSTGEKIDKVLSDFFNLYLSENYGNGWYIQRHGCNSKRYGLSGLWAFVNQIEPRGCDLKAGYHPAWAVTYDKEVFQYPGSKHFWFNYEYLKFKCKGKLYAMFNTYYSSKGWVNWQPGVVFHGMFAECCERKCCHD